MASQSFAAMESFAAMASHLHQWRRTSYVRHSVKCLNVFPIRRVIDSKMTSNLAACSLDWSWRYPLQNETLSFNHTNPTPHPPIPRLMDTMLLPPVPLTALFVSLGKSPSNQPCQCQWHQPPWHPSNLIDFSERKLKMTKIHPINLASGWIAIE